MTRHTPARSLSRFTRGLASVALASAGWLGVGFVLSACGPQLEDDAIFLCQTDSDCAPGYRCIQPYPVGGKPPDPQQVCWPDGVDPVRIDMSERDTGMPDTSPVDTSMPPDTTASTDATATDTAETTDPTDTDVADMGCMAGACGNGETCCADGVCRSDCGTCSPGCSSGAECVAGACLCAGTGDRCESGLPGVATAACSGTTCNIGCAMGNASCDAQVSTGCETDLTGDAEHCGACGVVCGVGATCDQGACTAIAELAAGDEYTCMVRADGAVVCWGVNDFGQAGADGSQTNPIAPASTGLIARADAARALAASDDWSCAITGGAEVSCWGRDPIDTGAVAAEITVLPPAGQTGVVDGIALGDRFGCGWTTDGAVYCWGDNSNGELGALTPPSSTTAIAVSLSGASARKVVAGRLHACAIAGAATPELYCWGRNDDCALGSDGAVGPTLVPLGGGAVVDVAAGRFHTCAVVTPSGGGNNQVWCFGQGTDGRLGSASTGDCANGGVDGTLPVQAGVSCDAQRVVAGRAHTCAVCANGTVQCWGDDAFGQLGDGAANNSGASPVLAALPAGTQLGDLTSGADHLCAVNESTGQLLCWGAAGDERLGVSVGADLPTPSPVLD